MERERPKEIPLQFPKIPKEALDKFDKEFGGKSFEDMAQEIIEDEPFLGPFTVGVAEQVKEPDLSLEGAYYVFKALKLLESQGITLPQVSERTLTTFLAEDEPIIDMLNRAWETREEDLPEEERKRKLKEGFDLIDRIGAPEPYNYAEENPGLMVRIAEMQHGGGDRSGIVFYALKRRQYISDQLEKRFFGKDKE